MPGQTTIRATMAVICVLAFLAMPGTIATHAADNSIRIDKPSLTRAPELQQLQIFENVSSDAGITASHQMEMVETYMVTGQAWGDYNNDGWIDLYVTNSVGPNTLYRNNGDGTFSISTETEKLAERPEYSGGAVFVDYDNDGWKDLYVLNHGENSLFRNMLGTTFLEVSSDAGVNDIGKGETAAWGDYNGDGHLDLYVANWACDNCSEGLYEGWEDRLYRNNGDGTFTDVTSLLGFLEVSGPGYVASFVDYDNDGDSDIYLVNDKGSLGPPPFYGPMNRNVLWRNDGPGCGGWCFTETAVEAGADARVDGMGLAIGDYDNDQDLDFYFSHSGPSVLLQNQGDGSFLDDSAAAGVDPDVIGWGAVFIDYDNDGLRDIYLSVMNGTNRLFRNLGDGTFDDKSIESGAACPLPSIGVAYADYDRDGLVDLVIGNYTYGYLLYRNRCPDAADHNWLSVRLTGGGPVNRDAVGSRVYLTDSDGVTQLQEVKCGSSLGAGNDLALHFGLGDTTVDSLTVVWTNGVTEVFPAVGINQEWTATYPLPAN